MDDSVASTGDRPVIPQEDHKLLMTIWGWLHAAASSARYDSPPTLLFTNRTLTICSAIRERLPDGDPSFVEAYHHEALQAEGSQILNPELDRLLRCARFVLDKLVGVILSDARRTWEETRRGAEGEVAAQAENRSQDFGRRAYEGIMAGESRKVLLDEARKKGWTRSSDSHMVRRAAERYASGHPDLPPLPPPKQGPKPKKRR